ncbi:MAG: 6-phosphogluconolactonase [Sedimentisphaerales bacterium]|nr:6-phosphogluconolactonase [Sedimentisphaerales bacterium]
METVDQSTPHITKVTTPKDLAHKALTMFSRAALEAIQKRGRFYVALSGGHTPQRFFELLSNRSYTEHIPWDRIEVFWVDERCVPPDAKDSNYGMAADIFLSKVRIPKENVHRISGECQSLQQAASAYEETIRRSFRLPPGQTPQFDLIVLGMCPDGHIGSLYPNSYALIDTEDLVAPVYRMEEDYSRITLTPPVLTAAHRLMILISGSEKAAILGEVMRGEPDPIRYPVHTLWPVLDRITWIVDEPAARFL